MRNLINTFKTILKPSFRYNGRNDMVRSKGYGRKYDIKAKGEPITELRSLTFDLLVKYGVCLKNGVREINDWHGNHIANAIVSLIPGYLKPIRSTIVKWSFKKEDGLDLMIKDLHRLAKGSIGDTMGRTERISKNLQKRGHKLMRYTTLQWWVSDLLNKPTKKNVLKAIEEALEKVNQYYDNEEGSENWKSAKPFFDYLSEFMNIEEPFAGPIDRKVTIGPKIKVEYKIGDQNYTKVIDFYVKQFGHYNNEYRIHNNVTDSKYKKVSKAMFNKLFSIDGGIDERIVKRYKDNKDQIEQEKTRRVVQDVLGGMDHLIKTGPNTTLADESAKFDQFRGLHNENYYGKRVSEELPGIETKLSPTHFIIRLALDEYNNTLSCNYYPSEGYFTLDERLPFSLNNRKFSKMDFVEFVSTLIQQTNELFPDRVEKYLEKKNEQMDRYQEEEARRQKSNSDIAKG